MERHVLLTLFKSFIWDPQEDFWPCRVQIFTFYKSTRYGLIWYVPVHGNLRSPDMVDPTCPVYMFKSLNWDPPKNIFDHVKSIMKNKSYPMCKKCRIYSKNHESITSCRTKIHNFEKRDGTFPDNKSLHHLLFSDWWMDDITITRNLNVKFMVNMEWSENHHYHVIT